MKGLLSTDILGKASANRLKHLYFKAIITTKKKLTAIITSGLQIFPDNRCLSLAWEVVPIFNGKECQTACSGVKHSSTAMKLKAENFYTVGNIQHESENNLISCSQ